MARKYKTVESLQRAIKAKEERYTKAQADSTRQFQNIGWGAGMRLSKMPSCGFSKVHRLRDELRELYCQLDDFVA